MAGRKGCRPRAGWTCLASQPASVSYPSFRVQVPTGPNAVGRVPTSKQY